MSLLLIRKIGYKTVLLAKSYYCYFSALISYLTGGISKWFIRQAQSGEFVLPTSDVNTHISLDVIETKNISEAANRVLDHKVIIFNSKYIDVSRKVEVTEGSNRANDYFYGPDYRPIDWHCDIKNNYRWHKLAMPYLISRKLPPKPNVDIKWPWELSRCQHLPVLAIVGHLAAKDNPEFAGKCWNEFQDEVVDWIVNNPVGLGVNWACEMDVAIRVVNLLVGFLCFGRDIAQDDAWSRMFRKSVQEHGRFLYKRLRRFGHRKKRNHYVAELAGLYILGLLCPFIPESTTWSQYAKEGLERGIQCQVQADGTHYEDSTAYHLLVTEIFLYTGMIADSLGESFSDTYHKDVGKMVSVIELINSSRHEIPQIGDNDDGYFIKPIYMDETHTRVGHILDIGDHYVNHKAKWLLHEALINILLVKKQEVPRSTPAITSKACVCEDAGWVVLEEGPVKIVMCVGSSGVKSRGGHSHEDILSFTLYWKGLPVIVDPGTYVYAPDQHMRNKFRYGISHNQPQYRINEEEWVNKPVFAPTFMPLTNYVIIDGYKKNAISAEAKYKNYIAKRRIDIIGDGDCVSVFDELRGNITGHGVISLCLHPDVNCEVCADGKYELTVDGEKIYFESDNRFEKEKGFYSAGYGLITETDWLIGKSHGNNMIFSWNLKRV